MSDLVSAESPQLAVAGAGPALRTFKRLSRGKLATVEHGFGRMPLVDVYELAWFPVVSSADEMNEPVPVQFYVYHTTDRSARVKAADGTVRRITVEDPDDPPARIPFARALEIAGVGYGDDSTVGDTVTDFWSRFFSPPSDTFDETSYGNSPWIDVNVGDRRTVGDLKNGGGWDDLWLTFRPRKTINGSAAAAPAASAGGGGGPVFSGDSSKLLEEARGELKEGLVMEAVQRIITVLEMAVKGGGGGGGGGAAEPGTTGSAGAPPGVEVVQLGLDAVGLRLMDGGPDEVAVMVLFRP
jgi:hypothetical protein